MFGRKKKPEMPGVPQQGIVTTETHLLSLGNPGGGTRCVVAAHPEHPEETVAIDWSRFPVTA